MAKTTEFQGSKFYVGIGLEEAKAITACTISPNATITAAGHGLVKGDGVKITGLGTLDGYYPVENVKNDVITLSSEVIWADQDMPTKFADAKVAKIKWSSNFCEIKSVEGDGDTLSEEDVTTMCSEGTETEPGDIEYGSVKLTFFWSPGDSEMQKELRKKFFAKETFPYFLALKKNKGSLLGSGFIQTSPNFSGEVKGKWESGVTIKKAKRDYLLPATA